jgi:hypothetical protein
MQLTDEMRKVILAEDEKAQYYVTHAVVFPDEPKGEPWPYDWDVYYCRDYTIAQERTAELAIRDITDTLIVPMYKL